MDPYSHGPGLSALVTVRHEVATALDHVDPDEFRSFADAFPDPHAGRVLLTGQGRSGLCAAMAAMRLMHLGYAAHVVGEVTAPAITSRDTLVVVSGSGRTPVSLRFAEVAAREGASVLLVSQRPTGPLPDLADRHLVLPATASGQFGGTLFEQTALVVLDAIVLALMPRVPDAETLMAAQHTRFQ